MKNLYITTIFLAGLLLFSCSNDDEPKEITYDYHAHIESPNTDNKHVGHTIDIKVNFESHTKETIHHIKVQLVNKADGTVIYDKPSTPHIHATSGSNVFEDTFELTEANGVTGHTDWILRAKVWGHEKGEQEVTEEVEFHVHPM